MVIRNGSIYWVDFSPGKGSEPIGRRPGLVIQNDLLNDSNINTVIMLAITSTLKFGELPGNVILRKGVSLSNTFVTKFLTLKDTEDSQSSPASLTQTALLNEPLLLANQFRLD